MRLDCIEGREIGRSCVLVLHVIVTCGVDRKRHDGVLVLLFLAYSSIFHLRARHMSCLLVLWSTVPYGWSGNSKTSLIFSTLLYNFTDRKQVSSNRIREVPFISYIVPFETRHFPLSCRLRTFGACIISVRDDSSRLHVRRVEQRPAPAEVCVSGSSVQRKGERGPSAVLAGLCSRRLPFSAMMAGAATVA